MSLLLRVSQNKIKVLAGLYSFLEALGMNLLPRTFKVLAESVSCDYRADVLYFLAGCQPQTSFNFFGHLYSLSHCPLDPQVLMLHYLSVFSSSALKGLCDHVRPVG